MVSSIYSGSILAMFVQANLGKREERKSSHSCLFLIYQSQFLYKCDRLDGRHTEDVFFSIEMSKVVHTSAS